MKKIAVISVHPDDETLGCGGTILKHNNSGDQLIWIILTNVSEDFGWAKEKIAKRQTEIDLVAKAYNFKKTYKLDFETTKLDTASRGELTNKLAAIFKENNIDVIYTPNRSDIHSDHRVAFECIMSASKIFNHPYLKEIFMYECISETEFAPPLLENAFLPNFFVDITKHIDKKIEIMKIFESEIKKHPFPRSERNIRALGTFRGAQSGCEYAESFMILRLIWS